MALKAYKRGQWRSISRLEAALRHRRGEQVVDDEQPDSGAESGVVQGSEQKTEQTLVVDVVGRVASEVALAELADEEMERLTAPDEAAQNVRRCSRCGEPGHTKAKCPRTSES